jgi:uncharacterized phiE125 gp8 family phage protein
MAFGYEQRTLVQTEAPTEEPVTVAEAKAHLRVTHNDDDSYITALIKAARADAEALSRRQFVTATYEYRRNRFPKGREPLDITRTPLQSVTSVKYTDTDGTPDQTWDAQKYQVDTGSLVGRIVPAYSESYPAVREGVSAVIVTFVAGFGAASAVPQEAKHAILLCVGHWYENREAVVMDATPRVLPLAVSRLLSGLRLLECA